MEMTLSRMPFNWTKTYAVGYGLSPDNGPVQIRNYFQLRNSYVRRMYD